MSRTIKLIGNRYASATCRSDACYACTPPAVRVEDARRWAKLHSKTQGHVVELSIIQAEFYEVRE